MSNFTKMHLIGVEFFHADGRTDMRKLIAAIRSFSSAPTIIIQYTPCELYNVCSLQNSCEMKSHCVNETQFSNIKQVTRTVTTVF